MVGGSLGLLAGICVACSESFRLAGVVLCRDPDAGRNLLLFQSQLSQTSCCNLLYTKAEPHLFFPVFDSCSILVFVENMQK